MKFVLNNIFLFLISNLLFVITTYGQSTQSASVRISIKLIKMSDAITQNASSNEVILNAGSNELSRDLVLNFSKNISDQIDNHGQILIDRKNAEEKIKVDVNKSFCLRNVEMNEKIRIIPPESLSLKDINSQSILTIAY